MDPAGRSMQGAIRCLLASAVCGAMLAAAPAMGAEIRFKDNDIGSSNVEIRGPIGGWWRDPPSG